MSVHNITIPKRNIRECVDCSGLHARLSAAMDDDTLDQMTNERLAETLRESGGCQDEALARLLEADVKNHDANVNSMDKWRELLLEAVLAFSFYMNRPGDEEATIEAVGTLNKCALALDMPAIAP